MKGEEEEGVAGKLRHYRAHERESVNRRTSVMMETWLIVRGIDYHRRRDD